MTDQPRYKTFVVTRERRSYRHAVGNLADIDLSAVDIRALTPAQWELIKQEVKRRACAERSKLVADLIARLCARLATLRYRRDPVVQSYAVSHEPNHWFSPRR
jgi:hypothetical protein